MIYRIIVVFVFTQFFSMLSQTSISVMDSTKYHSTFLDYFSNKNITVKDNKVLFLYGDSIIIDSIEIPLYLMYDTIFKFGNSTDTINLRRLNYTDIEITSSNFHELNIDSLSNNILYVDPNFYLGMESYDIGDTAFVVSNFMGCDNIKVCLTIDERMFHRFLIIEVNGNIRYYEILD